MAFYQHFEMVAAVEAITSLNPINFEEGLVSTELASTSFFISSLNFKLIMEYSSFIYLVITNFVTFIINQIFYRHFFT